MGNSQKPINRSIALKRISQEKGYDPISTVIPFDDKNFATTELDIIQDIYFLNDYVFSGPIIKITPQKICLLSRKGPSVDIFWSEETIKNDFYTMKTWNNPGYKTYLAVPAGIYMYQCTISEESRDDVKIFIPLRIVDLLYPISIRYLQRPRTEESYNMFIYECKEIFKFQRK